MASAKLAMELLDELLEAWNTEPVPTIAGLDMGKVEESELERRFKVALHDWIAKLGAEAKAAGNEPPVNIKPVPSTGGREAFELRFSNEGEVMRYRLEEQEGLSTTPSTTPDFVFTRQDAPGRRVAVYLDGYQFHASNDHNNIAGDAAKRRGVRANDHLVWSLTWDDVDHFHKAAVSESSAGPQPRPMLTGQGKQRALQLHLAKDGAIELKSIDHNPMQLLLDYLQGPDDAAWTRLALTAVGGAFASGESRGLRADDVAPSLMALANGEEPTAASSDEPEVMLATHTTPNGLLFGCLLRQPFDQERWTVVASLPDGPDAIEEVGHRRRWHDWLQWGNLLQFLGGPGRQALIGATSSYQELLEDVWLLDTLGSGETEVTPPAVELDQSLGADLSEAQLAELSLIVDDEVAALVTTALRRGAPDFVAGHEMEDGAVIEAAWPDQGVGVVLDGEEIEVAGWDLRTARLWTTDALLSALGNG